MSTSRSRDSIRASALASLVAAKYQRRLRSPDLAAIPELQGLAPERRLAVIDTAIGLGWLEESPSGEVFAPSPLDEGRAA